MKKILILLLTLAMACLCSSCESTPEQRGVSGRAYISSTRPAIRVEAGDMPVIIFGKGTARIDRPTQKSIDVQACIWGSDDKSPMALLLHAELPGTGLHWADIKARPGAIQKDVEHFNDKEWQSYTYLVPGRTDPFAGLVGDPVLGSDKQSYWLARFFSRRYNGNETRIILEYREPAPAGMKYLSGLSEEQETYLLKFRDRARSVFVITVPEKPLPEITRGFAKGIRWQYVDADILGEPFLRN